MFDGASNLTIERVHSIRVVTKIDPDFENLIWCNKHGKSII